MHLFFILIFYDILTVLYCKKYIFDFFLYSEPQLFYFHRDEGLKPTVIAYDKPMIPISPQKTWLLTSRSPGFECFTRFLVEVPLVSFWKSYVTPVSTFRIHKIKNWTCQRILVDRPMVSSHFLLELLHLQTGAGLWLLCCPTVKHWSKKLWKKTPNWNLAHKKEKWNRV